MPSSIITFLTQKLEFLLSTLLTFTYWYLVLALSFAAKGWWFKIRKLCEAPKPHKSWGSWWQLVAPAILNFFPSPKAQISSASPQHICTHCFLLMVCFKHFHFLADSDLHPCKVSMVPWFQVDLDDSPLCFYSNPGV